MRLRAHFAMAVLQGLGTHVTTIERGGHFGELALITKEPRAATCKATTDVKLLVMGRDAFERLIGDADEIFKDTIEEYKRKNSNLSAS